jgi:hypothetical protein
MKKFLLMVLVLAPLAVLAQVTGSTSLTVGTPTVGTQGLISGCVVNSNNTPTCSIPSGWTLAAAEGFESGALGNSNESTVGGSGINCSKGHTGNCSVSAVINNDGAANNLIFNEGSPLVLGHSQFYLSFWDNGNGVLFNEEYTLIHIIKHGFDTTHGQPGEEEWTRELMYTYPNTSFNDPNGLIFGAGQGNHNVAPVYGSNVNGYGSTQWNQWEFWIKYNTPGNNNDGFFRTYLNGVKIEDHENINIFGSDDATGAPLDMNGAAIEAGGWYTKNVWTSNGQYPPAGACTAAAGQGGEAGSWVGSFSSGVGSQDCPPAPPKFTRYIDDVVLLTQ